MGHRLLVQIMSIMLSHTSQQRSESSSGFYAGAVFKRFLIYNNLYFECFQAFYFDNLVESKFQLCNNENKVSF